MTTCFFDFADIYFEHDDRRLLNDRLKFLSRRKGTGHPKKRTIEYQRFECILILILNGILASLFKVIVERTTPFSNTLFNTVL